MKSSSFFSRSDYVATKVFLVLVAALYPLLVPLPRLLDWVDGRPLVVRGLAGGVGPLRDEPTPGIVTQYADWVVWTIEDPTVGQRAWALVPSVLTTLLVGLGAAILWRLVTTTQRGAPFDRRAVRQLRVLGVLVMVYGLVATFGQQAALLAVFWSESGPSLSFGLDFSALVPLVVGFVVLVVAECFRVGLRLREDVEGLV